MVQIYARFHVRYVQNFRHASGVKNSDCDVSNPIRPVTYVRYPAIQLMKVQCPHRDVKY